MTRILALALFAIACGPADRTGDDTEVTGTLEITPADLEVTIVDGVPVAQPYSVARMTADGQRIDITARASLVIINPEIGTWSGATLTITGVAAGPTRVVAIDGEDIVDTGLVVRISTTRFDSAVPANVKDLFGAAGEAFWLAPSIEYPPDGVVMPPNLGTLDVHWRDTHGSNLFEVSLRTEYIELVVYRAAIGSAFTTFTAAEWQLLATSREPVTLAIAGLDTSNPTQKGTAVPRQLEPTNEAISGGVYYWTTQPNPAVMRYDMSTPGTPASTYFSSTQQPTQCIGCHTLSRDGTKMALTLDSGNGRGTVVEVASGTTLVDYTSNPQYWNFATFIPDGSKLVTVNEGAMVLRSTMGGAVLTAIPNTPGYLGTQPELSPDGTRLANVETTSQFYDFQANNGAIVTRTFDTTTNTFGPITTLVANLPGASSYYPSWSPDGAWLMFTRTIGNSYSDSSAELWVVKADGTQPPIRLAIADPSTGNMMSSWARWAPFRQTLGATNTPLYYFTFSTVRPFGVRQTVGTQIWMAPFFADRAELGQDPSGTPFWLPFQRIDTSNHIAQWTEAVVLQ